MAIAEKELGWIGDGNEPAGGHAEHADLVDAAEPILRRAQHALIEKSFALEVEHRVDDVLERLWARDAAALRDVPDDEHRRSRFLREAHQPRGAFAHLADVSRRAFELVREDRLDRVDEHRLRPHCGSGRENRLELRLGDELHVLG